MSSDPAKWPISEQTRAAMQKELQERQIIKNCVNCENFHQLHNYCMLYSATPPATTIVVGCPKWIPDIPF